ncbi:MAG: hypothetical protein HYY06_29730 [Deltaproteobacteria bacterium]|nr:hypothetical protein [Deltaproteobacteria bacterium]
MNLDVLAAQLAQLLTTSDKGELEEIVRRWRQTAASPGQRELMEKMGDQVLALKSAFDLASEPPSREELEVALGMMLRLAASGGDAVR